MGQTIPQTSISQRLSAPPEKLLSGKETTCHAGDIGDVSSIPGLGRSPGRGHGNTLQLLAWRLPWRASLEGYRP